MYRNKTDLGVLCVCMLQLYWGNLSLITTFIEYFYTFCMLIENRVSSLVSDLTLAIFFSHLFVLSWPYNVRNGRGRYHSLVFYFRGKCYNFSLLIMMLSAGISYMSSLKSWDI